MTLVQREPIRAIVASAGLAVVVGVLVLAGRGDLETPPVGSAAELSQWLDRTDTVTAALAMIRVVGLAVAVWTVLASAIGAVARVAGHTRLATIADRALPGAMRWLLSGAGAASVIVLPGIVAGDDALAGEPPVSVPAAGGEGTATMSIVPDAQPPTTPAPSPPLAAAPVPTTEATWTVEPGDSFWSIADEVLADAWGRTPTDAEIDPYWRALIAANRDRITSGNPDLIYPGQVFTLPPA